MIKINAAMTFKQKDVSMHEKLIGEWQWEACKSVEWY